MSLTSIKLQKFLQSRERTKFADFPYEVTINSFFLAQEDTEEFNSWVDQEESAGNLIRTRSSFSSKIRFAKEETKTYFYLRWGHLGLCI